MGNYDEKFNKNKGLNRGDKTRLRPFKDGITLLYEGGVNLIK